MANFTVIFYKTENTEPIKEFLDSLNDKMAAKILSMLKILEDKGNALRKPKSESINDGIFELRCKVGSDISRIMYFFYYGKKIVITNGFIKKTQKTPIKEIQLAKKRRAEYISREENRI